VLTGAAAYRDAAAFIARRLVLHPSAKLLVVVSAENGTTDALLALAREIVPDPDPEALDLLWSTGELRSVALLTLAVQALGVRAGGLNAHQTGLVDREPLEPGHTATLRPLRLRAALDRADVLVVPGFLVRGNGDSIRSLGRGGSDLTAVLLAAGLQAGTCELVKDVPGYFSDDPNVHANAQPLDAIDYECALQMARDGCELVQPAALEAARDSGIPLVVRALHGSHYTVVALSDGFSGSRRAPAEQPPDTFDGEPIDHMRSEGGCVTG
jgi:aspartate kinase